MGEDIKVCHMDSSGVRGLLEWPPSSSLCHLYGCLGLNPSIDQSNLCFQLVVAVWKEDSGECLMIGSTSNGMAVIILVTCMAA